MLGVLREYAFEKHRPNEDQWIRKVHQISYSEWIIICCSYAQSTAMIQQNCFQADVSFKLISGKTNVFSIGGWDEEGKRK
jgi:hypothetical protein